MFKNILVAAAVIGALAVTTPGFALDGQEALDQCNATRDCAHNDPQPGGPIVIVGPKGGLVECKDEKSECRVVYHAGELAPT